MKNKKLIISLSIILVAIIAVFAAVVIATKPATVQGAKEITVTVVSKDKSSKVIDIDTDAEFLGDALYEEKIVNEEEYKSGFYTVINGEKADYNVDKSWWCVTKNGEMTSVGMNEQSILDGDKFEITYTIS
jgi:D-arabinose 1-dehydrogenase-like Zn-dependent alcohol dehydrogenase